MEELHRVRTEEEVRRQFTPPTQEERDEIRKILKERNNGVLRA